MMAWALEKKQIEAAFLCGTSTSILPYVNDNICFRMQYFYLYIVRHKNFVIIAIQSNEDLWWLTISHLTLHVTWCKLVGHWMVACLGDACDNYESSNGWVWHILEHRL